MSESVKKFETIKYNQRRAQDWGGLLGKEYFGGTRGRGGQYGKLVYLQLAKEELATPTIYHQASDGATNYHPAPREFLPYLAQAIRNKFPDLLADALAILDEEVKASAKAALDEHNKLMEAAGLTN